MRPPAMLFPLCYTHATSPRILPFFSALSVFPPCPLWLLSAFLQLPCVEQHRLAIALSLVAGPIHCVVEDEQVRQPQLDLRQPNASRLCSQRQSQSADAVRHAVHVVHL